MAIQYIYLDNSATTKVDPRVLEAMLPYFNDKYGNPSSIHALGMQVNADMIKARETVAQLLGASPKEIMFTGSGSEADNFALVQTAKLFKNKGKHIITTAVEHKAILKTAEHMESEGYEITYLPVNSEGMVDMDAYKKALRKDTVLVSVMQANNEVGTIMPIREMADMAHSVGAVMHTDAVQAAGKVSVDVNELGVDMMTISAHKIYAPKGIGALYIKESIKKDIQPLITGGAQESGLRAGTENTAYIAGFARAAEIIINDFEREVAHIKSMRDLFESRIQSEIPHVKINGDLTSRVCSISNITFKYIEAEAVIGYVPQVCCSMGSACTAGQDSASHVLVAMNIDPVDIRGTLRFSFGRFNSPLEVNYAVEYLKVGVEKLRKMSPLYQQSGSK